MSSLSERTSIEHIYYEYVIFDADWTLFPTYELFISALQAIKEWKTEIERVLESSEVEHITRSGMQKIFEQFGLEMNREMIETVIDIMSPYYSTVQAYPDWREIIEIRRGQWRTLIILTSNSKDNIYKALVNEGLGEHFVEVVGNSWDGLSKSAQLTEIIERYSIDVTKLLLLTDESRDAGTYRETIWPHGLIAHVAGGYENTQSFHVNLMRMWIGWVVSYVDLNHFAAEVYAMEQERI